MRVRMGNREISSDDSQWSAYFRGLYHGGGDDDEEEINSGQRSDFGSSEVKEKTLDNDLNDDRISRSGTNVSNNIRDDRRNYNNSDYDSGHYSDGKMNTSKTLFDQCSYRKHIVLAYCFSLLLVFYGPKVYNYMNPVVIPRFKVEMASVYAMQIRAHSSNLWNVTLSYGVTAGWNFNFAFTNPSENHLLSYSDMLADVYFRPIKYPLWATEAPGFDQAENSTQFVHLNFARNHVLMDDIAAYRVSRDVNHGSSSNFYLKLHGNVTQKPIGYKDAGGKKQPLDVSCYLDVEFLCKEGNFMALATPTMCKTSSPTRHLL